MELCTLLDWVKSQGLKVIVVFEGRDAVGKGGTIKAITERVRTAVAFRICKADSWHPTGDHPR